jgi:hypothetical protein
MDLKKLIKEVMYGDCCKAIKPTKAPILNENLAPREILSEGLKYHIDNKKPLTEHVYRAGSSNYFNLWAEARSLYTRGILDFSGDDLEILTETHLGEFGIYEGKKVPLDFIMEEEEVFPFEYKGFKYNVEILSNITNDRGQKLYKISIDGVGSYNEYTNERDAHIDAKREIDDQLVFEGKKKSPKKDPPIGKPMRDSSGGKAYKVYVRDPKTKKIKTVRFGSGGLKAKINNSKARQAFAKRHKCSTRNDKTKASYWSCRLPRYAKLLGLKSSFSGFW